MTPVLLSVLMLASEAAAGTPATTSSPEAVKTVEEAKAERKICKREAVTESRMGAKKICLTAAQWKARQDGKNTDVSRVRNY